MGIYDDYRYPYGFDPDALNAWSLAKLGGLTAYGLPEDNTALGAEDSSWPGEAGGANDFGAPLSLGIIGFPAPTGQAKAPPNLDLGWASGQPSTVADYGDKANDARAAAESEILDGNRSLKSDVERGDGLGTAYLKTLVDQKMRSGNEGNGVGRTSYPPAMSRIMPGGAVASVPVGGVQSPPAATSDASYPRVGNAPSGGFSSAVPPPPKPGPRSLRPIQTPPPYSPAAQDLLRRPTEYADAVDEDAPDPNSFRYRSKEAVAKALGNGVVGQAIANFGVDALDLLTPVYALDDIADLKKALAKGDWLQASLIAGGLGLSIAPILGPAAKALKGGLKVGKEVTKVVSRGAEKVTQTDFLKANKPFPYEIPGHPQRPFKGDYPDGVATGPNGRPLVDVDGTPIETDRVVGRAKVGEADQALPEKDFEPLINEVTDLPVVRKSSLSLNGAYGQTHPRTLQVAIDKIYAGKDLTDIEAHEIGHLVHSLSGTIMRKEGKVRFWTIDKKGVEEELDFIFNDLNNPALNEARRDALRNGRKLSPEEEAGFRPYTPKQDGYSKIQSDHELWAEAVRAYLRDPNYIKSVAPNVAARIRQAWNSDPLLRKYLHFNSFAPFIGGAGAAAAAAGAMGADGLPAPYDDPYEGIY